MALKNRLLSLLVPSCLALLAFPAAAMDEGLDAHGNEAIGDQPFTDWPGVMEVINDTHRVYYYRWGRGEAAFYFKGTTKDVNAALNNFAKIKAAQLDVVLRPAPARVKSFRGRKIESNWVLNLPYKWAIGMPANDLRHLAWDDHPVLSIYVGDGIDLSKLEIPDNVRTVQLADLQRRYAQAVKPEIPYHITTIAADNIARLDPYNPAAMYRVAKLLGHEKLAVRNHSARAIARFGATAKLAVKKLQAGIDAESYTDGVGRVSIAAIKASSKDPAAEAKHKAILKEISEFVANR